MAQKLDVQYIRFYTDGSAAKKVAPIAPLQTIKLPKLKKHKKLVVHIDPVALCAIAMCAVMLVQMTVGGVKLYTARQELAQMNSYVQTLQQEQASLSATMREGYDLAQIERTALALGMVPKDQVQHVSIELPAEEVVPDAPGTWERFYTFLTGLFA